MALCSRLAVMWELRISEEDDEPFDQKMKRLTGLAQAAAAEEGAKLDRQIAENLAGMEFENTQPPTSLKATTLRARRC